MKKRVGSKEEMKMKQKIHKLVQKIEQKEITDKSDDLVQEANKFYPELGDKLYEYFSYYSGRYVTKIEELVYSLKKYLFLSQSTSRICCVFD